MVGLAEQGPAARTLTVCGSGAGAQPATSQGADRARHTLAAARTI